MKDLYSENYNTLSKESKEDTNKWKGIPCTSIGRIIIVKMLIIPPKAIYKLNATATEMPMAHFFNKNRKKKKYLKFI